MLKDQNICEFAGLPASGKTQFAHWICLYTLVINPLSKVIFIDSGSNFSPHRLRDFWSHEFFKDFKRSIVFSFLQIS
jgi:RecA/RadA recombinase